MPGLNSAVVTSHLPTLRRYAHRLAGTAADGDDLLQEACEKMLRHLQRVPAAEIGRAWCYAVLRNCWIDIVRRRKRHFAFALPLDDDTMGDEAATAGATDLRFDDIWRHIGRLQPMHREIIMLCCIEDLTSDEAATVLDIPAGTVRSRLARAKLALADAIGLEVAHA
ncbi:RNA polymerase sigma factor [Zavarzinia sp.]|uniref:RNA polymerase sigma factor n=1 Tax=Zavarzinia sp. TaxID=2027920 RepID=UPI00356730ED